MNFKLIPELDVADLEKSIMFYTEVIGFVVTYERPEERFVFLELDSVSLMLEEAQGPGRRFRTAPLEYPFGRGVNFQIQVVDVNAVYSRVKQSCHQIIVSIEERWYRKENCEVGNRQFVVADPDGYLLRFFTDLGERSLAEVIDQTIEC